MKGLFKIDVTHILTFFERLTSPWSRSVTKSNSLSHATVASQVVSFMQWEQLAEFNKISQFHKTLLQNMCDYREHRLLHEYHMKRMWQKQDLYYLGIYHITFLWALFLSQVSPESGKVYVLPSLIREVIFE